MVGVLINWYLFSLVYSQGKCDISIRVLERVAGHPDSFMDSRNKALGNHCLTVQCLFPLILENRHAKSDFEGLCCWSVGQEKSRHFPKYHSCLVLCLAFFFKWVRMLQKIVMVGTEVRIATVAFRTARVARAGHWLVDVPLTSVLFYSITWNLTRISQYNFRLFLLCYPWLHTEIMRSGGQNSGVTSAMTSAHTGLNTSSLTQSHKPECCAIGSFMNSFHNATP